MNINPRLTALVAFLALAGATFALHGWIGTFDSEFGRYQDEGMHYVTSAFFKDYFLSGQWTQPMRSAQDFYLHFPKLGLGNWPPVFPVLNSLWMIAFGDHRNALLVLMALLTAWLSWLVWLRTRNFGPAAACPALVLILSGASQFQTSMVMAEVLLAVLTWLAMMALVAYLDAPKDSRSRVVPALAFGVLAMLAIMTKGNAWILALIAPLLILASGQVRRLLDPWLWAACLVIAAVTIPYTVWSTKIVVQGWDTRSFPGWMYLAQSLAIHLRFVTAILGPVLTIVAAYGVYREVLAPLLRRQRIETFWLASAIAGVVVIVFHTAVPTSIEPRKIFQITPILGVFLASGLWGVGGALGPRFGGHSTAATAALLVFLAFTFEAQQPWRLGFRGAVEKILANDAVRERAILVSSSPFMEDAEAALIATWAERERTRGNYIARATKTLLADPIPHPVFDLELPSRYSSAMEVQEALNAIPISYVIAHSTAATHPYQHLGALAEALGQPRNWAEIYRQNADVKGRKHEVRVYQSLATDLQRPVRLDVSLKNKIGVTVSSGTQ